MAIIARARTLRKQMTPTEARLWSRLRELRAEGLHFRRQSPRRGYILDFVCLSRRLIVEVDGEAHADEDRARKDRVRDAVLARDGFLTLRFPNSAIRNGIAGVVEEVRQRCLARPTRSSRGDDRPPLKGREDAE